MKLLFREGFILNVKWDNLLLTEFVVKYNFIEELRKVSFMSVPRYLFMEQYSVTKLELHSFCDTSIQAYSTVIYVGSSKSGNIVTNLLTAKSKILKIESISFLLLLPLIISVRKVLSVQVKISNVFNWSDSKFA